MEIMKVDPQERIALSFEWRWGFYAALRYTLCWKMEFLVVKPRWEPIIVEYIESSG